MARVLFVTLLAALVAFMLVLGESDADGCAAVRRSDRQDPPIVITEEGAIIIWDSVKKVEHFIRRAAFDTPSPNFGFLVPTPDIPTLKEMEDAIFRKMDQWIMPKIVDKADFRFDALFCVFGCSKSAPARGGKGEMDTKSSVRVLSEQKVGGFETVILEADKTDELSDWLKKNGYSNDPELQSWLVPYVAAKWKITAFKIMQDPKTGQLATTKPVRMSFKTDRPFFPYREPEDKTSKNDAGKKAEEKKELDKRDKDGRRIPAGRMLRVFFVSDLRMEGKLGDAAWHANVPWADHLTDGQRKQILAETGLLESAIPAKAWLTTFEDSASPRPGKAEVYFDLANDQTRIRPPDFIRYYDVWIQIDCTLFGVGLVAIVVMTVIVKRRRPLAA